MKTVKMSLDTIQGKLSRAEMKNIMAGCSGGSYYGGGGGSCSCGYMEYRFSCTYTYGVGMMGQITVCDMDGFTAVTDANLQLSYSGITPDTMNCTPEC